MGSGRCRWALPVPPLPSAISEPVMVVATARLFTWWPTLVPVKLLSAIGRTVRTFEDGRSVAYAKLPARSRCAG